MRFWGIMILLLCGGPAFSQDNKQELYYNKPAKTWTEALPVGNGFMGAMIFGDPVKERIQLNESTLYSGDPATNYKVPSVREHYNAVMERMRAGRYAEAQGLITKQWLGRALQCYQPMSDLLLDLEYNGAVKDFRRYLDISNAVAGVEYTVGATRYERRVFASNPDRVLVLKMSAAGPGTINGSIRLTTPHTPVMQLTAEGNAYILNGRAPGFVLRRSLAQVEAAGDQRKYPELFNLDGSRKPLAKTVLYADEANGLGMYFQNRIRFTHTGGEMMIREGRIVVKGVQELVLYITAATSFKDFQTSPALFPELAAERTRAQMTKLHRFSYSALLGRHIADYRQLFDRVRFTLNAKNKQALLPTDQRIMNYAKGSDEDLVTLFFQYGRYLMIAGSRVGGQPLNLQGMWNDKVIPPWASAYTTNINLEMNYWPAELTNLSECHQPLFKAIKELAVNGKEAALRIYGNQGWMGNHNMSIWREADPIDICACSFWPMVAGWLTSHLWEHYLFTGDKTFLKTEVYPLLKGAVLFYKDWLIPNGEGYLVTPVGHSPENAFVYDSGQSSTLSPGPTMDMAIIRESFSRFLEAQKALGVEDALKTEIEAKLGKLLPYQVGSFGQLQEWQWDFKEQDVHHRHLSHLYPFHPGNQITPNSSPVLTGAVKRVLERRGDQATGWSMGWKVNLWARLYDGNRALSILSKLIHLVKEDDPAFSGSGCYANLFDACPPFQIDGNFGATAGITEMLLQSHDGYLHLLPALPDKWAQGSIKGIKARGDFEVDISWAGHQLTGARIIAKKGGILPIKSPVALRVKGGRLLKGAAKNPMMEPIRTTGFLDHSRQETTAFVQPAGYTYYLSTKAGEQLILDAQ
ncbi:glycoside hydrolase family 95 protein [Niabella drilacis]|uniref:Alpha-L-fucosidase 2 n=1 Tax=Niabella drilacis (strain DSM 25811 / CCM 8410 / CCUG 62505 / LMG 26954 / E90) TaxID=1285928 RepID=A0A1G6R954_NIADE|nr:glycoside hydrolase family 95 protein [Niabella drilacis]SDD00557.1 alpha-L-fucosidase 2 [Niabella drilacis]